VESGTGAAAEAADAHPKTIANAGSNLFINKNPADLAPSSRPLNGFSVMRNSTPPHGGDALEHSKQFDRTLMEFWINGELGLDWRAGGLAGALKELEVHVLIRRYLRVKCCLE
jgi:hypothetical protein